MIGVIIMNWNLKKIIRDKNAVNIIKFVSFILLIVTGLLILFRNRQLLMNIDIDRVVKFISEKGSLAVLIYMVIYVAKPFLVVIPSNVLAIISGIIFGPIKGFVFTMTGFFISGTIAFYVARLLGKGFVESIIGKRLLKLDNNLEHNGFKILFMLRLPPILPYDPLSYACGFTKIHYTSFIIASLIGVVPETLCYSILGKNYNNVFSFQFIIPVLILVLGVVLSTRIMKLGNKSSVKR